MDVQLCAVHNFAKFYTLCTVEPPLSKQLYTIVILNAQISKFVMKILIYTLIEQSLLLNIL